MVILTSYDPGTRSTAAGAGRKGSRSARSHWCRARLRAPVGVKLAAEKALGNRPGVGDIHMMAWWVRSHGPVGVLLTLFVGGAGRGDRSSGHVGQGRLAPMQTTALGLFLAWAARHIVWGPALIDWYLAPSSERTERPDRWLSPGLERREAPDAERLEHGVAVPSRIRSASACAVSGRAGSVAEMAGRVVEALEPQSGL